MSYHLLQSIASNALYFVQKLKAFFLRFIVRHPLNIIKIDGNVFGQTKRVQMKIYDRLFMLKLKNSPVSLMKPAGLSCTDILQTQVCSKEYKDVGVQCVLDPPTPQETPVAEKTKKQDQIQTYDRFFMLKLKNSPASLIKPAGLSCTDILRTQVCSKENKHVGVQRVVNSSTPQVKPVAEQTTKQGQIQMYDRLFMLKLKNSPASLIKPAGLSCTDILRTQVCSNEYKYVGILHVVFRYFVISDHPINKFVFVFCTGGQRKKSNPGN